MPTIYLNEEEKALLELLSDEIWRNQGAAADPPAQFGSWDEAEETLEDLRSKINRAEQ
jgi:hypothetical protein